MGRIGSRRGPRQRRTRSPGNEVSVQPSPSGLEAKPQSKPNLPGLKPFFGAAASRPGNAGIGENICRLVGMLPSGGSKVQPASIRSDPNVRSAPKRDAAAVSRLRFGSLSPDCNRVYPVNSGYLCRKVSSTGVSARRAIVASPVRCHRAEGSWTEAMSVPHMWVTSFETTSLPRVPPMFCR